MDPGIMNVMRRVEPTTAVTAEAGVVTATPPAAGCNLTFVLAANIVPLGNPEPSRFITVTPGCPAAGEGDGTSVTPVCVSSGLRLIKIVRTRSNTIERGIRGFCIGF
jgi:hypothetical protein